MHKKIIDAQADSESLRLKEAARLEIKEKENKIEVDRKQKEAEVAGTAKWLLYEAEAKGVTELAKSLGLEDGEQIIIKQLETLKDALKDNNFNIIMNTGGSNSGGLQDLLDLAKIKLLENKKENE
jgi:regulator of protease activity HflC (stomatin/prohibitin superfamily)